MSHRVVTFIAVMLCLALSAGCGRSTNMETAVVRGTVTLDGKPFSEGGAVLFQPEGAGKMATGSIQSDGTYELTTYTTGDGAIVGKHTVVVLPIIPQASDDTAPEPPFKSPIPKKYEASSTSGLVCEVKAGEVNEFPIEMISH